MVGLIQVIRGNKVRLLNFTVFTSLHPVRDHTVYEPNPDTAVASAEIFGISILVSDHDCDKQPSYEYCGERTKWF